MSTSPLSLRHALLALAVVVVWGSNFVVIRVALDQMPPLLFAALRFTFALLPAVFFVRRPSVPWRNLAAYGLLIGVGLFGVLYIAMRADISPGLASLVIQMQVFFTIGLSVALSGERPRAVQIVALLPAAGGIAVIAAHAQGDVTATGLLLVLLAAASWAGGNIVGRAGAAANMLAYVVWASLFSAPPLFALSLLVEGWPAMRRGGSCCRAIRRRRSRRWRCWCRWSAWPPRRCSAARRCRSGSCLPPGW